MRRLKTAIVAGAVLALAFCMAGCGTEKGYESTGTFDDDSDGSTMALEDRSSTVEQVADYTYADADSGKTYHYVVVKNNGSEKVEARTITKALDANGETLATVSGNVNVIGPGLTSVCTETFSAAGIDSFETEVSGNEIKVYDDVLANLALETSQEAGKVTVSVTNNNSVNATFVKAFGIFTKGGKCVYLAKTSLGDKHHEIVAGETATGEIACPVDFDNVEVYLSGETDGRFTD